MNKESKTKKDIKVIPLIPSLSPDEKLIKYINQLIEIGFKKIIVINDGSSSEYDNIFNKISNHKECIVIRHYINQGKGRALKTGFNYFLNNFSDYCGVVTADSDGQHSPKDTYNVALALEKNNKNMILGTRNFNEKQVPFKSRYGNKITTNIMKLLYGKRINDTQTGLRGISTDCIKKFMKLDGEKFDYEINMLIYAIKENIKLEEVLIETIYLNENKSSHFNAISDSIKIYKLIFANFLKFTFSGLFSSLIDIALFSIFIALFKNIDDSIQIILATIFARIISSFVNFNLNHKLVFKTNKKKKDTIIKYYILCILQMITSSLLVTLIFKWLGINKTLIKIIVDLILFFVSYRIQRKVIFK